MAAEDTMWFELGVRDNVSKTLSSLMEKTEDLKDAMKSIQLAKGIFENALKIEQAYDKIAVALRKIEEAKSLTKDREQLSTLMKSEKKLKDIRTKFEEAAASEDFLAMKGTSAFTEIANGLKLAVTQVDRYTKTIDEQSRAEERHKNEELRRVDELKAKYNELQRYRKQWTDTINNLAPGINLSGDMRHTGQSLDYRINAVQAAMTNGTGMPKSATGADYDKFIAHMKEQIRELTSETDAYNTALAKNDSITRSLNQNLAENISKRNIADIKGQQAEYDALTKRIGEIQDLIRRVQEERTKMETQGVSYKPNYTQERVSEELAAIQRRYNEELARNQQEERKTAAAKKEHEIAVKNMINANRDLISIYNRVEEAGRRNNTILDQMKNQLMGFAGLYGIERLLKNVIQIGGEFEVQRIALQSILGDVQQANSMFEQMKELAVVSPFNFRQLAAYTKQVAAFGIPYEEMYDTTKRLADMSAGLGVDMGRLILAYGQVRSAAVLRGQELRQFTEAGIPLVQELAKEFTKLNGRAVSTAEVFELISKRAVPFEMVKKIMWDMTNEGGRFFNMQFTLSDTLAGKWSNLRDAWEIMLSEFAKGESLSGKFLKGMVTLTTKILESMQTLMPLIGGGLLFAGLKSLKDITGVMGMNGINANIAKTQQLYFIEMKRKLVNQEITREQFNEAIARSRNKDLIQLQLAQEGKLKAYQIQKLMLEKNISNEKLLQLARDEKITMREAAQVRLWRMKYGQMSSAKVAMMEMANGVGKFLKANWQLIAIDVLITAATSIYSYYQNMKRQNKELKQSFSDASKSISESYESINKGDLASEEDYSNAINGLKELLKEHSANYDAIERHANGISNLKEQYEYLKAEMKSEVDVSEKAEQMAEKFGNATRNAFENAKKAARDFIRMGYKDELILDDDSGYGSTEKKVEGYVRRIYEQIIKEIPDVGKSPEANELYRKLRNGIEEQLGFGKDAKMLINIKLNELLNIDNIDDATTLVVNSFGEMLKKADVRIANKLLYGTGELEAAEKKKVEELINKAAADTIDKYPYYKDTLQRLLNDSNFVANIQLRFTGSEKPNEYQKQIYNNMPSVAAETTKNLATSWGKEGSSYAARNAAKQEIDSRKNELEAREREYKAGKTTADRVKTAKDSYNEAITAALSGLGYDYKGELKKSNKIPKSKSGSQKDAQLESWKNQLKEIQEFWREYETLAKRLSNSEAINKIRLGGVFPGMFNDNGELIIDTRKGISTILRDFLKNTSGDTADRKKFQNEILKTIFNVDNKAAEDEAKKIMDMLKRELSEQAEQFSMYKDLFSKTGNADFSMSAFVDGQVWDDQARALADQFYEMMNENLSEGGTIRIDWDADENAAEEYFRNNFNNSELLFEMWKNITKLIRENYKDGIKESADAMSSLYTEEEKIKKIEQEIINLRRQGIADNDLRMIKKQKELEQAQADAFSRSSDYLKFYEAILSMTIPEAEAIGQKIRKNLNKEMQNGTKSANQYLKEIKNIEAQMKKLRESKTGLASFLSGGMNGYFQDVYDKESDKFSNAAIQYEDAAKQFRSAFMKGDQAGMVQSKAAMESANSMMKGAGAAMEGAQGAMSTVAVIDKIIHGINDTVQAMKGTFDEIQEMYDALGKDTTTDAWTNASGFFDTFSKASQHATDGWDSLKNGNIGGAIQHTVGSITSWITGIAKTHDKKLDNAIIKSQKEVKKLGNEYNNIVNNIERVLGGIYTSGGYNEMLSNLKKQYAEVLSQMENEDKKKKTDEEKMEDYRQQLKEMDVKIKDFAEEWAKTLYGIDVHSWASQLGDALFDAWQKGEDGAEAFKNKAKEIIAEVAKSIAIQKIIEKSMEPVLNVITSEMTRTEGKLDEQSIENIAMAMQVVGSTMPDAFNSMMEGIDKGLQSAGFGSMRDDEKTSSAMSSSIKSVTENTADLLASYINAIRADVSVNREVLLQILVMVQSYGNVSIIATAQLEQLRQITANTDRNANAAEMIYNILRRLAPDGTYISVK